MLIRFSREEIAQIAGTTMFAVSRLLSEWERLGLVKTMRQAIVVIDHQGLTELTEAASAVHCIFLKCPPGAGFLACLREADAPFLLADHEVFVDFIARQQVRVITEVAQEPVKFPHIVLGKGEPRRRVLPAVHARA
jgi:Crp-like helix-turn-helix domain